MIKFNFFNDLINSLFDKPNKKKSFNFFSDKKKILSTKDFIDNVALAKGEVSALSYAEFLMQHCEKLDEKELIIFFKLMRENFDISSLELSQAEMQREGATTVTIQFLIKTTIQITVNTCRPL